MIPFFLSLPIVFGAVTSDPVAPDPTPADSPEIVAPEVPAATDTDDSAEDPATEPQTDSAEAPVTDTPAEPPAETSAEPEPGEAAPEDSSADSGADAPAPSGFPVSEAAWTLTAVDGAPFDGAATLIFPEEGRVAGKGPCNNFMGGFTGTTESFAFGPLATTQMACPDMTPEQTFLTLLAAMTSAEVSAEEVILSSGDGRTMSFAPAPPEAPTDDSGQASE